MNEECKSLEATDFDRDAVDELNAKVPVQENFTDCGIFILEYVIQVLLRPSILARLGKYVLLLVVHVLKKKLALYIVNL